MTVTSEECCKTAMENLKPNVEYKVTVSGVDSEGLKGFKSTPLFALTSGQYYTVVLFFVISKAVVTTNSVGNCDNLISLSYKSSCRNSFSRDTLVCPSDVR